MQEQATVDAIFGFSGFHGTVDGLTVSQEQLTRLRLPAALSSEHLSKAKRDAEILLDAMSAHPDDVHLITNASLRGDLATARATAEKLGITEPSLIRQGGGYLWLVVAVIAVAAALTLESDSPHPPPPPPAPDGGAPDGGTS